MSLRIKNEEYLEQESLIQKTIFDAIDTNTSMVFNAGAGAGKTFALIESLKYIITRFGFKLAQSNQRVICITYTNTAVQEIRERLGDTALVVVSTIHERLWELIKDQKKELVLIHEENLKSEIEKITYKLYHDESADEYAVFRSLSNDLQNCLIEYLLTNKDLYYKNIDRPAAKFKAAFGSNLDEYPNMLRNVTNFKKIACAIYRISNYRECLSKISASHPDYRRIEYDSKYNNDILHKMLISHDTLMDYAHKLFHKYSLLKRLCIDKHPYLLIDEYQDSNQSIIEILNSLHQHAKEKKLPCFIGYFGDPSQNIYEDGIGSRLQAFHPGLAVIEKEFNRRSHKEIIDVINTIRGGSLVQRSIYNDCTGGSVKFYYAQARDEVLIHSFLDKYRQQWETSIETPLHCLVLTNKKVAEYSGFAEVFNKLSSTKYYKDKYQQVGSEILSHEIEKLGRIPLLFFKILQFKFDIERPNTRITKLINEEIYKKLSFADLKTLNSDFKSLQGETLGEYIDSIFTRYNNSTCHQSFKMAVQQLIKLHSYTYQAFNQMLFENLFSNIDTEDNKEYGEAKDLLQSILDIPIEQFLKWFHFINETQNSDVIYHTYHGTKGRQYDNIIIIMENDFGAKGKNKFSSYFTQAIKNNEITNSAEIDEFKNTQNLLYVACSRTIKNLRILYLDDTTKFSSSINQIFGGIYSYTK